MCTYWVKTYNHRKRLVRTTRVGHSIIKYSLFICPLLWSSGNLVKFCNFYQHHVHGSISTSSSVMKMFMEIICVTTYRLTCLVLSCLVLSCLVLSCLVLSCLVLSCLVLSCLVLSCLVLSCLVLSCLVLSCLVLSCLVLSCWYTGQHSWWGQTVRVGCACLLGYYSCIKSCLKCCGSGMLNVVENSNILLFEGNMKIIALPTAVDSVECFIV